MKRENRHLVVAWRSRSSGKWSHLSLGGGWALGLGAASLVFVAATLVLSATVLYLLRTNSALDGHRQVLVVRCEDLGQRAAAAEAEIGRARDGLTRVRAEEAKIRSWLGLEEGEWEERQGPDSPVGGGKGSLGEVDLETVAPEDRGAEAEAADGPQEDDLGLLARGVAHDLSQLARFVRERKKYWDAVPAIVPVEGEHWVSSGFGWRASPFTGDREFHSGIDLAGKRGTPIVAPADGIVARVVRDLALGRAITLDHGHGLETMYGHLSQVLVKKGQRVKRGQTIGKMGSTGNRSTGPHLHYAVKLDGKFVNPNNYFLERERLPFVLARKRK